MIILNCALVSTCCGDGSASAIRICASPSWSRCGWACIGLLDDLLKLQQKKRGEKNRGLVERYKLAGQVTVGLALGLYLWQIPLSPNLPGASTTLPFFKYVPRDADRPGSRGCTCIFVTFMLTGTSNAVNITDGLDGLAAGLSAIAFGTFAIFAYIIGRVDCSRYLGSSISRTRAS